MAQGGNSLLQGPEHPLLCYNSVVLVDPIFSYWICVLGMGTLLCVAWLSAPAHAPVLPRCSCSCLCALHAVYWALALSHVLNAHVVLHRFFS